ncbi:MAG: hypothetical protein IPK97_12160 [Ahniella sp.]|nr:hypothetical protein [Ahniella sp.]
MAAQGQSAIHGSWNDDIRHPAAFPEGARVRCGHCDGSRQQGVARDIRTSLRGKIDRTAYTIKLEGGDSLLFVAEMGTPRFELALIDNSVSGIEVEIASE